MSDLFNRLRRIVKTAIAIFGLDPQLPHDFARACLSQCLLGKECPFGLPVGPFRAGFACRASSIAVMLC